MVSIACKTAYIQANEIVNHLLEKGIDIIFSMLATKKTGLINQAIMKQNFSTIFIKIFQQ